MATTALDREAIDEAVAHGSDLLKQGKLDEAAKAFRAALMLDENNPRVLALLGLTYFKAGSFPQAQPIYEELVERSPTDASHRLNLGLVYLKLGESEKAIGALESSRALDPSQGRAVSYLGLAYARAGRYAEAYRSFLLAGQNELATEIEANLTSAERDSVHAQLARTGEPRTAPPRPPPGKSNAEIGVSSTPAIATDRAPSEAAAAAAEPTRAPDAPEPSLPEIDVDVDDGDGAPPEVQAVPSSPAASASAAAASAVVAPNISTESQQFVLPARAAVPTPVEGQSMISRAVEVAVPSAAAAAGVKAKSGATPPIPLSQLATEGLVRAGDDGELFEVTSTGALVIRVVERTITRLEGVHIAGGELDYEPATRRSRGSQTDEKFDYGGSRFHVVSGKGYLIAVPSEMKFTAVTLDDDIFYLREDLVFAFDAALRWENGNVPGLRGKLPVVQFRGDGAVALRTSQQLVRVKLPAQGVIYVDATRLAGWIGRVIPRAVVPPQHGPMGDICVECTGEGVVLVDPTGALPPVTTSKDSDASAAREPKMSPPPPPPASAATAAESDEADPASPPPGEASGPIELDVVKNADWLSDDGGEGEGSDKRDEI